MAQPLTEYSQERIRKVWGDDDHLFLVVQLRKVDELAQAVANIRNTEQARLREDIGRL